MEQSPRNTALALRADLTYLVASDTSKGGVVSVFLSGVDSNEKGNSYTFWDRFTAKSSEFWLMKSNVVVVVYAFSLYY